MNGIAYTVMYNVLNIFFFFRFSLNQLLEQKMNLLRMLSSY